MSKQKGFTLVELLVVVAIIGLLSTLAVVSLGGIREKARDTKRVSDMDALKTAMELVNNEEGGYDQAGCSAGLVSDCTGGNAETYLPGIGNLTDPSEDTTACDATCSTNPCNYAFVGDPGSDSYDVYFYLESGSANLDAGCHKLSEAGIE